MNKLIILLAILFTISACKGPGSGPLDKESFKKTGIPGNVDEKAHMGQVTTEKIKIVVEPCDGCVTIASLIENKKSYSGKVIKVKGKVTKFNPEIMEKNWIHIQDGSEFDGGFDLTITTDATANVGDTLTFEGKIALDKDFGYGYVYNVLMEEGKIVL